jgi:hypothetical protein
MHQNPKDSVISRTSVCLKSKNIRTACLTCSIVSSSPPIMTAWILSLPGSVYALRTVPMSQLPGCASLGNATSPRVAFSCHSTRCPSGVSISRRHLMSFHRKETNAKRSAHKHNAFPARIHRQRNGYSAHVGRQRAQANCQPRKRERLLTFFDKGTKVTTGECQPLKFVA